MIRTAIIAAAIMSAGLPALAEELTGHVSRIRDGDTLVVDGRPIRLCGIDAPERSAPGGSVATAELRRVASEGTPIRCVMVGSGTPCDGRSQRRSRDRFVAQCFVGKVDLAMHMVTTGNGCDWRKFSGGAYAIRGGCIKR